VVVAIATLRSSADSASSVPTEDPPSLTFRLVHAGVEPAERPSLWGAAYPREAVAPPPPPVRHASTARREAMPAIHWRHATSLGLPWSGSLVDGVQLPIDGPNWVTWDPLTDSVPNQPKRLYGNQRTIHAILAVTAAYHAAHPKAPRVVVGDISREGGGPMTDEHISHQNGLDVDVYYPRLDRKLRAPTATGQIDRPLAQDLVDRFVAAGAQMIFVGFSSGLHGPAGVVIPYANHEFHMHVRFPPPGT
jgi:murein endopeptidase